MRIRDFTLDLTAALFAAAGLGVMAYAITVIMGGLAAPLGVSAAFVGLTFEGFAAAVLRARVVGGTRLYSIPASSSAPMSCEAATVV